MVLQRIRSALDRLSIRALLQRFDKRQLQSQIDTHKLYLLTRLHADRLSGRPSELPSFCIAERHLCPSVHPRPMLAAGRPLPEDYAATVAAEAGRLGHEVRVLCFNDRRRNLIALCSDSLQRQGRARFLHWQPNDALGVTKLMHGILRRTGLAAGSGRTPQAASYAHGRSTRSYPAGCRRSEACCKPL